MERLLPAMQLLVVFEEAAGVFRLRECAVLALQTTWLLLLLLPPEVRYVVLIPGCDCSWLF